MTYLKVPQSNATYDAGNRPHDVEHLGVFRRSVEQLLQFLGLCVYRTRLVENRLELLRRVGVEFRPDFIEELLCDLRSGIQ